VRQNTPEVIATAAKVIQASLKAELALEAPT